MQLIRKNKTVTLAVCKMQTSGIVEYSDWFESTFDCILDCSNRDTFEGDFYFHLINSERYSGIVHLGYLPKIFDKDYYRSVCFDAVRNAGLENNELFFLLPNRS